VSLQAGATLDTNHVLVFITYAVKRRLGIFYLCRSGHIASVHQTHFWREAFSLFSPHFPAISVSENIFGVTKTQAAVLDLLSIVDNTKETSAKWHDETMPRIEVSEIVTFYLRGKKHASIVNLQNPSKPFCRSSASATTTARRSSSTARSW